MVATSFTGCGKKATTESILADCSANFKDVESVTADIDLDMDVNLKAQGMIMPINANLAMSTMLHGQEIAYVNANIDLSLLGEEMSETLEMFTTKKDNVITVYSYDTDDDAWYKEDSELDEEVSLDSYVEFAKSIDVYKYLIENKDKIVLAEELIKYEDSDCYSLTGTINSNKFAEYVIDSLETADFTKLGIEEEEIASIKESLIKAKEELAKAETTIEIPVTVYVYKDEMLPAYVEIDLKDSLVDLSTSIEELIGSLSPDTEISCTFDTFKISSSFKNYNKTKVELTDAAKAATEKTVSIESLD